MWIDRFKGDDMGILHLRTLTTNPQQCQFRELVCRLLVWRVLVWRVLVCRVLVWRDAADGSAQSRGCGGLMHLGVWVERGGVVRKGGDGRGCVGEDGRGRDGVS